MQAQQATDTTAVDSLPLAELVITATRSLQPVTSCPAVQVLKREYIRDFQVRTAPEALALIPGMFIQKTNHGGGSPFIRGLTGNQVLFLIDGIRMSNATYRYGPNQYLNTIDPFSLEQIEALRGVGSVQYGSDALGGIVHARSITPEFATRPRWSGNVLLRAASQGMEKSANGRVAYSRQRMAFTGGVTYRDFGDLVGGDSTGRQTPSGYRELAADFKSLFLLKPDLTLTAAYQTVQQSQVPVYHKVQLENFAVNEMDPQIRHLGYVKLEKKINRGIWKSFHLSASVQTTEEQRNSRKNNSNVLRQELDQVRSLGFIADLHTQHKKHWEANTGVEIYHDLVNSRRTDVDQVSGATTRLRGLYPNGAEMLSAALFSLHQYHLGRWHFEGGARFNLFKIQVQDEVIGTAELTPSALVGNAGIRYDLGRRSRLFATLNTGYRAPNIDDMGTLGIVDFRYETPNYDLKPEHATQLQLGYKWIGAHLQGEVYVYQNQLRDLIARVRVDTQTLQGYPLYTKENIGEAYIRGLETAWRWHVNPKISLLGSLTYTFGQNTTAAEPLRRIPPMFGNLELSYRPLTNLEFKAAWQAAEKQDRLAKGDTEDNRIPKGGTPGWQVFNLHAKWTWQQLTLQVSGLNLGNVDYRTHGSGVNGYGRSVWVTVGLRMTNAK